MFSLDQLRGFVAVAQELHFGRAAERLHMTQPPLSRQVQNLEREVGAQLLDRNNRRVALTPAGEVFLVEAQRLLALAQTAPDLARRVASGSAGTIRIGFTAASTYVGRPALLDHLDARLPDVDVDLQELVTREQVAALLSGELDLGLARPPFDTEAFASRLLKREALVVAVPTGHRLARLGRPLEPADVAREPLVMHSPTRARYFYDLVVSLVPVDHVRVVHTVDQVLTMVWLVSAGRGIAFVPAATRRLRIAGVEYLPLAGGPEGPVEMHLLWTRDSRNPALGQVLRSMDGFTV